MEEMVIVAARTLNFWESEGDLKVLVPVRVTVYVSIVALTGIVQLVITTPFDDATIVREKTSVEVVCVRICTVTISEALYPLALTLAVIVRS